MAIENPVLEKGKSYSEPFSAIHVRIRLEGHPCDVWQIESRRVDDPKAPWEVEKRLTADERATDLRGCKELEYRIAMGIPDCEGYVFEYSPVPSAK